MNHISKKCLLTLSLTIFAQEQTFSTTHLSEEAVIASYQQDDGAWKYVEFLCIVQPKNQLNKYINHGYGAFGGIGALYLIKNYFQDTKIDYDASKKNFFEKALLGVAAATATKTIYDFFTCYMKRSIRKETLQNILHKWNVHRPHFPSALIPCFDELHALYADQGDDMLNDMLVSEVFELIQHHIEHFFDKRYKQEEEKKEGALPTFKTITDVWKNLG